MALWRRIDPGAETRVSAACCPVFFASNWRRLGTAEPEIAGVAAVAASCRDQGAGCLSFPGLAKVHGGQNRRVAFCKTLYQRWRAFVLLRGPSAPSCRLL